MVPQGWIPHRREDGELVGWIRPEGDDWVAVSLLGRDVSGAVGWVEAEEVLDELGLRWLAEIWTLERPGQDPLRVRIVDVRPGRVVVQTDDFGAVDAVVERVELGWPAPAELRPRRPDDPVAFGAA
ncbi:hypothetical protein [Myceligenerans pegani]|uniref:Uncharacterized protein n=1 Tax=Myceligenerans pegani TaxID=2776917 RepID=A0ABR9N4L6_9MICO|nr:hypothetical protein [Myceligenerans sp. TRM 65318]MBE1878216.1 hypothetical protein [Myceligenerans sp. TRM 65318]MBE3020487.1 hypothetical protein [Myceligenerans sp. TRM 65318]